MMRKEIDIFIKRYAEEIQNGNAALFAGAGFSKAAGYVDWKSLIREIAYELGLKVEKEKDLVTLAQFLYNKNKNRSTINNIIYREFSKQKDPTENHRILARLPINLIWTTNYDDLLEKSYNEIKKIVDVKSNNKHLSLTKPNRECVIYKMHGDKDNPDDAILIKDDYERYYKCHKQFLSALAGDLISKTFLFVGFSFNDPNIDYILSRVRIDYAENSRQHYAIMKEISQDDYDSKAEYEYNKRRTELFLDDLSRYNIKPLIVDDYSEVTEILTKIEQHLNKRNVFISGSAQEYGNFSKEEADVFIKKLSQRLIKENYNIISGFGLGVGSSVIVGALEEIYMNSKIINHNRLLLRPFPQGDDGKSLWRRYREDMISHAGISIFLFGNKRDEDDNYVLANGVEEEFEIAVKKGNIVLPIASTGYMAKKIWKKLCDDIDRYYPNINDEARNLFFQLNEKGTPDLMISRIIRLIKVLRGHEI